MLHNYLKIALRNLARHKGYTFINIGGLAVGMACCLLVLLYVREELSYDRFHEHADRIYRIVSDWGGFSVPATSPPTVARLETDFPEIEIARIRQSDWLVRYGDRGFQEDVLIVDPAFFEVFTFPLLVGDPATALAEPYTIVLTEKAARRYFGAENPVGKTLRLDNSFDVEVTGVAAPAPENSHFHFDFLLSWSTLDALINYSASMAWGNNAIKTYLLLPEGYAPETLEAQFPAFIQRHAGDQWNGATLSLQPLTSIHLHSHHSAELEPNSDVAYVYVFSVVAAFILLIASINFMNLATARSAERAKEVGVRKTVGAARRQLVAQFLTESVLMALLALCLAAALAELAQPALAALAGRDSMGSIAGDGTTLLLLLVVAVGVGLLAGSYPALVLSGFEPESILRGRFSTGVRGALLRKGLVVFQFATSVVLIVGTLVAYYQLEHLRNARLGFDEEQVLTMPIPDGRVGDQYAAFKNALLQQPGVQAVSHSSEPFPSPLLDGWGARFEGAPQDSGQGMRTVAVGHDFFEALGVEMAAGRSFSRELATDSSAYVLNETALAVLGKDLPGGMRPPQELIGQRLVGGPNSGGPLIGVVKDFNMATLHEQIEPILFHMPRQVRGYFLVRVESGGLATTVASIERTWRQVFPEWLFSYSFADEGFDAAYRAEERLGRIFMAFAGLAIFIACLGLFGLAAFSAQKRTKEIGVRKVLGASVPDIIMLLSMDFLKLVLLAVAVGAPVGYVLMRRWLEDFAYQVGIGVDIFLATGVTVVLIGFLTVSYQAVRAAMADPVESLRYE